MAAIPPAASNSLTWILEERKVHMGKKVKRLEANVKAAKVQLKAINDLLISGSTPTRPISAKK